VVIPIKLEFSASVGFILKEFRNEFPVYKIESKYYIKILYSVRPYCAHLKE
jgi:hypothetical protein